MNKITNLKKIIKNSIKELMSEKEGVKHYTKDGKEWKGATHKMPNGPLMTQDPHNEDSEELFHKEDLTEKSLRNNCYVQNIGWMDAKQAGVAACKRRKNTGQDPCLSRAQCLKYASKTAGPKTGGATAVAEASEPSIAEIETGGLPTDTDGCQCCRDAYASGDHGPMGDKGYEAFCCRYCKRGSVKSPTPTQDMFEADKKPSGIGRDMNACKCCKTGYEKPCCKNCYIYGQEETPTKVSNPSNPSIDKMMREAAKNLIGENQLLLESYYCNTYDQNGVSSVQNSNCMQCAQQNGGHNCPCFGTDANGQVFTGTLQNDTGTYEGWNCGSVGGPTTNTPLDVDVTNKTKNIINPTTNLNMPSTSIDRMMAEATENILKND